MTEKRQRLSQEFRFEALQHWADMLQKKSKAAGRAKYATGRPLLAALTAAYTFMVRLLARRSKPSAMSTPTSSTSGACAEADALTNAALCIALPEKPGRVCMAPAA